MKKYKLFFSISLFVLTGMSIFIITWQNATYNKVQEMYPLEKSSNKEASAEFLKAMEYRIYIKELHPFFDYDSFIITPLLKKLDYHFQKGKSLLPNNSVEDIVWWTLFYKEIYALLGPPRNDLSLAFRKLPFNEFKIKHDMIYKMIMRYPNGVVNFQIEEIKKFRFQTMAILSGFYYKRFSTKYNANTMVEKSSLEQNDLNAMESISKVKDKYKVAYKKFIRTSKRKEFMENEFWSDMVSINTKLIINYVRINKTQELPFAICNSEDNKLILKNVDSLIELVKNENTQQSRNIYNRLFEHKTKTNVPTIFKMLHYRCPNLRPTVTEVVMKIDELNRLRNKRKTNE